MLRQLHWLPVRQRITFKLAMITFKCLHGLAPSYLADVCIPVSSVVSRWQLQSADSRALVVPRTRHDRSERLRCVGPGHMEQLPLWPADFITVNRDIHEKTKNSFIWLRAPLNSPSNRRYTSSHIHSFIHSSNINPNSNPNLITNPDPSLDGTTIQGVNYMPYPLILTLVYHSLLLASHAWPGVFRMPALKVWNVLELTVYDGKMFHKFITLWMKNISVCHIYSDACLIYSCSTGKFISNPQNSYWCAAI